MIFGRRSLRPWATHFTSCPYAAATSTGHRWRPEVEIRSAGTLGLVDVPADPKVAAVAREIGIDLTAHRSQALTEELVRWADRVAVMEMNHAEAVTALVPGARVIQLGPLVRQSHIEDPIGAWFKGRFRQARDELAQAVRRVLEAELRQG